MDVWFLGFPTVCVSPFGVGITVLKFGVWIWAMLGEDVITGGMVCGGGTGELYEVTSDVM